MARLDVSLYGDCFVQVAGDSGREIRGTKQRALIALLATAPLGRRSRSFLQEALWGETCYDGGRQSLRRALSDIKRALGDTFDKLIDTGSNATVQLHLDRVNHLTKPGDGTFLEGIDIGVEGFEDWLRSERLRRSATVASGGPVEAASVELYPRIAVIPFLPVADGRMTRQLGDWFAEDISRALSRSHFLSVISHLSSRQFGCSRTLTLADIRAKLEVDYVLSGSVRRAGDELALDLDLVNTENGRIVATRSFRGTVSQINDLRCGMTAEVTETVARTIVIDLMKNATDTVDTDIDSHRLLVLGVGLMHDVDKRRFMRGRECLEEAIRRAPRATDPKAWLAKWHVLHVINGWSSARNEDALAARRLTAEALQSEPNCPLTLTMDGLILSNLHRELDAAAERYRAALKFNPNDSLAWLLRGMHHTFTGDTERGVSCTEKAHRLSPLDPFGYFYGSLRASAYCAHGDFPKALALADKSISLNPSHLSTLRVRIAALHGLDRGDEARRAASDFLELQPDFRVSDYLRSHPSAEYPVGQRIAKALRDSGIPD